MELCRPLAARDIAHDRAVRAELGSLRHLPAAEAANTVVAMPRPQPRRFATPSRQAGCE